ncbi:histidine kinase [Ruixingdingia sedimenti]|uniref:Histidine kinase n=1 Tax=Ruixingdingia sedimenti TaxID=3073604 RepID=A0ABU1FAA3_9RHOB|nr:histidine kinase [Xinfangfangia sp. LG-4]MDR5653543.1 histidine kinase [Xinfangfangia sp. LG-4]
MNRLAKDAPNGADPYAALAAADAEGMLLARQSLRILVLEDDRLLARHLCEDIRRAGDTVLGPFGTLDDAIQLDLHADAAILDIRVGRELSYPLAERLSRRSLPLLFYTGLCPEALPPHLRHISLHPKPCATAELLADLHWQSRRRASAAMVLALLPRLRVRARELLHDPRSADRLVEATLAAAIPEAAQCPANGLADWLHWRLEREYYLRGRDHMI